MTDTSRFLILALVLACLSSCDGDGSGRRTAQADADSDSDSDADSDSDSDGETDSEGDDPYPEIPCPDPDEPYVASDPGVHGAFLIQTFVGFGQNIAIAAGKFYPMAREDSAFEQTPAFDAIALDSCAADLDESSHDCLTDADCAPEQECAPDKDAAGEPIAGTGACITPNRSPLDVGVLPVLWAPDLPIDFLYTVNQDEDGTYTMLGYGSTIGRESLTWEWNYVLHGAGGGALGELWGETFLPAELYLTSPETEPGAMGDLIRVDPSAPLALTWNGVNAERPLRIDIAGGSLSAGQTYVCRVADDGAFTVPAEVMQDLGLGNVAMGNGLTLTRETSGRMCGFGLASQQMTTRQIVSLGMLPL